MIPENVMHELRYIEIYTAKKIQNLRIGTYTSPLRGTGFDFDAHRHYRPGDDIRRIDWNVTARMNEPYVRQTHAERELNIMIALDVSRSMDFGSAQYSKKEVLTFVAASLLFSALSDQINTGFLAFSDRVLSSFPPRRTKSSGWITLEELWSLKPPPGRTAILPAICHLLQMLKRMSVVFLVSDFMSSEDLFSSKEVRILAAKHDVIAVVLEDPSEFALPRGSGFINVRDMELGTEMRVGLSDSLRKVYSEIVRKRRQDLIRSFYRIGMDHVFVRCDQNFLEPLLQVFENRKRK